MHHHITLLLALSAQALQTGNQMIVDLEDKNQVAAAKKLFGGSNTTRVALIGDNKALFSQITGPIVDGNYELAKVHKVGDNELVITAQQGIENLDYSPKASRNLYDLLDSVRVESPEFALNAITDGEIDLAAYRFSKKTGFAFILMATIDDDTVLDVQIDRKSGDYTVLTAIAAYKVDTKSFQRAIETGVWDDVQKTVEASGFNATPHALLRTSRYSTVVLTKSGAMVPYIDGRPIIKTDEASIETGGEGTKVILMAAIDDDGKTIDDSWNGVYTGKVDGKQLWGNQNDQPIEVFVPETSALRRVFGDQQAIA